MLRSKLLKSPTHCVCICMGWMLSFPRHASYVKNVRSKVQMSSLIIPSVGVVLVGNKTPVHHRQSLIVADGIRRKFPVFPLSSESLW